MTTVYVTKEDNVFRAIPMVAVPAAAFSNVEENASQNAAASAAALAVAKNARAKVAGEVLTFSRNGTRPVITLGAGNIYFENSSPVVVSPLTTATELLARDALVVDLSGQAPYVPVKEIINTSANIGWQSGDKFILIGRDDNGNLYGPYLNNMPASYHEESFLTQGAYPQTLDPVYTRREEILVQEVGTNLANPELVNYSIRHFLGIEGNASQPSRLIASAAHEVGTGFIPVTPGAFYAIPSLGGVSSVFRGGYYETDNPAVNTPSLGNVELLDPPSGSGVVGKILQVPSNIPANFILFNLRRGSGDSINGPYQIQEGEIPTEYEPYESNRALAEDLRGGGSSTGSGSSGFDEAAFLKYIGPNPGDSLLDKLPLFKADFYNKSRDQNIVFTGTSITSRTITYCSPHPNASRRPPLMHSLNFVSHYWDAVAWEGQLYARYDSGDITETGSGWITAHDAAEWDDADSRHGLTRYIDGEGSLSFDVGVGVFAARFIYCPDSAGGTAALSVSSGNGKMQVFDPSDDTWKEANGFSINTLEAAPVARDLTVPDPTKAAGDPGKNVTVNAATKSNRTYQKRLKMRCKWSSGDSLSEVKTVTITRTTGRLAYWGFETSPREFMNTVINAARGSHRWNILPNDDRRGLPLHADNEVWGFDPTLIIAEHSHNDGTGGGGVSIDIKWDNIVDDYVFNSGYELSLRSRAVALGLAVPEIALFGSVIGENSGGFNSDGSWNFGAQGGNVFMTALDKYQRGLQWTEENYPETAFVNTSLHWVKAAKEIFGDVPSAVAESSVTGPTFLTDGTHPSDVGSRILASKLIGSLASF